MDIDSSLSLIGMFIQTISHSESCPPCLHLMNESKLTSLFTFNGRVKADLPVYI